MTGSTALLWSGALAVAAVVLAGPVPAALDRWRALTRRPRLALAAWSGWAAVSSLVLLAACGVAGSLLGLSYDAWFGGTAGPVRGGVLAAGAAALWLLAAVATTAVRIARSRRRHLAAVELVGSFDERLAGWVLEDARPLAYTVPDGRGGTVVVSRGVLALTDEAELRAVLHHEHQHGRRASSALLTAWAVWGRVWPTRWWGRRALASVRSATEMIADDAARAAVGPQASIAAICRLHTGLPAACDDLGWSPDPATLRRVRRLLAAQAA